MRARQLLLNREEHIELCADRSMLLQLLVAAVATTAERGGAKCTQNLDCQLNVRPALIVATALVVTLAALSCAQDSSVPCMRLGGQGLCTAGRCVCDPAWKGANCSVLNVLPAKLQNGFGHLGSNRSSWGAGVLQDPASKKWIMQVDEMNMGCGLGTWGQNSHCILAESDSPNGPYTRCVGSSVLSACAWRLV